MRRLVSLLPAFCLTFAALAHSQTNYLTTLHCFAASGGDYNGPIAGLIQGADGKFYGLTSGGGASDQGTFFSLTPDGVLTILHEFTGDEGKGPRAALVQANDGNFYGTAPYGGIHDEGTVFSLTPAGDLSVLFSFDFGNGAEPLGGLIQGRDAAFYGTTFGGGSDARGTVFRLTATGELTILHHFTDDEGSLPYGALVEGADGNFYGTTNGGGVDGNGTVFAISPAGELTTLHRFGGGSEGAHPHAPLIQARDGAFYGSTYGGGAQGRGTLFSITANGEFTSLYSLTLYDGAQPEGALLQGQDGNFYGATFSGGGYGHGALFQLKPGGVPNTLHNFQGADGVAPESALLQTADGRLCGTTFEGGSLGSGGTIFRFNLPAFVAPRINLARSGNPQVHEGAGKAKVLFLRAGDLSGDLAIEYDVSGTARSGVDYEALSGTAVIPAGSDRLKLKIKLLPNAENRDRRTMKIKLRPSATEVYEPGGAAKVKIAILAWE